MASLTGSQGQGTLTAVGKELGNRPMNMLGKVFSSVFSLNLGFFWAFSNTSGSLSRDVWGWRIWTKMILILVDL